ncbi:hypothetical protein [Streptosporangium sp. NPDC006007]|uniref:hypothetical protein n=1 Tax=Streptosporangium sp. NPDC006007 TaxID=3154575 RepID=UPI0033B0CFFF
MNDRIGQDEDRLVHKHSDDDLTVPSRRAEAPPGFEESRRGAPLEHHDGSDGTLAPASAHQANRMNPADSADPAHPTHSADQVEPTDPARQADRMNPADPAHAAEPADRADQVDRADRVGRAGPEVAVRGDRPAHPAASSAADGALFDQDAEEVRHRWQEVQTGFVDDPRDSVACADSLVAELTDSLHAALEARTTELRSRWQDTGRQDTEDLRTALRDYRALLEQLLDLSTGTR